MSENGGRLTLLAGGDVASEIEPVDKLAELILPTLHQADIRFAQCETVYTHRPKSPYRSGYLHPRQASIWKTAEIDVISIASNLTMNGGDEGLLDTIDVLRSMGKYVVGGGRDLTEARTPAIVERNGVRIAFLAYCSVLRDGHEAAVGKVGIAPMRAHTYYMRGGDPNEDFQPGTPQLIMTVPLEDDVQALQEDIQNAKQSADAVVLSLHWGLHLIPKALAAYQPVVAHAAIDAGADLILGHHAHILKGIEVYKGKVCCYSVGNFMITSSPKHRNPANWNRWNLYWYRVDAAYMPPHGIYHYPPDSRKTMLIKAVFSKKGIERVSFLPAFINPQAQPQVVTSDDPRFREIFEYMEWTSDQLPHRFTIDGNEVLVDTSM